MPSHNMTQREIWQIAAYVRTLDGRGKATAPGDAKKGSALLRVKDAACSAICSTAKEDILGRR